jgi:hypothetical protein
MECDQCRSLFLRWQFWLINDVPIPHATVMGAYVSQVVQAAQPAGESTYSLDEALNLRRTQHQMGGATHLADVKQGRYDVPKGQASVAPQKTDHEYLGRRYDCSKLKVISACLQ